MLSISAGSMSRPVCLLRGQPAVRMQLALKHPVLPTASPASTTKQGLPVKKAFATYDGFVYVAPLLVMLAPGSAGKCGRSVCCWITSGADRQFLLDVDSYHSGV